MFAFRQAVADWYAARYNVHVDPEGEVLGLIGSKEGMPPFHFSGCESRRNGVNDRSGLSPHTALAS